MTVRFKPGAIASPSLKFCFARSNATLFWTCIKIAKALKEFDGEE